MTDTWNNAAGGDWTSSSNWTSGVPTSADDVTIGVAGGYTVTLTTSGAANSLTIDNPSATLSIFDSGGSTASLAVQSSVVDSGVLNVNSGASMVVGGGLSVAAGGSVFVDTDNFAVGSDLAIAGGLTNAGMVQVGNATGNGADLVSIGGTLANTGTLNIFDDTASATVVSAGNLAVGGTINLSGDRGNRGLGPAELLATAAVAPTVLSSHITLFGPSLLDFGGGGGIGTIANGGQLIVGNAAAFVAAGGAVTSNSALSGLTSVLSGGDFEVQSGALVALSGGLSVAAGGSVFVDTDNFAVGSDLAIAGGLTNAGMVQVGNATGNGADLVSIGGTLANTGTLNIFDDTASATVVSAGNLAVGGTINLSGDRGNRGLGPAELLATAAVAPTVLSSHITLFGPSLLDFGGGGGIGTIANGGQLIVGNAAAFVAAGGAVTSNSALSGLTSVLSGGDFEVQSGALVALSGGLSVAAGGSVFVDTDNFAVGSDLAIAGGLTNAGMVQVGNATGNGADLVSIGGTLANTGTLNIFDDTASATVVSAGNLAVGGTINLSGDRGNRGLGPAELLATAAVAPTVLSSHITLFGPSLLDFGGGGGIGTIANGGQLIVGNAAAFVAAGGAVTSNSALSGLTSVLSGGDFEVQSGALVALSGGLSVAAGGSVFVDTDNFAVGSDLAIAGGLTNAGMVQVGNATGNGADLVSIGGTLANTGTLNIFDDTASATVVSAGNLAVGGTINLSGDRGNRGLGPAELLATAAVAPTVLSSHITLFGPSLLDFGGGGGIGTIANGGQLIVGNAAAFVAAGGAVTSNSALSGLTSVLSGGDFEVQSGALVALSGGLSVAAGGSVFVDTDNFAVGSDLAIAGGLTNAGMVQVGNATGNGADLVSIGGTLANTGTLNIFDDTASATVVSAGNLAVGGTINLSGDRGNRGLGPAELLATAAVAPTVLSSHITLFGPSLLDFGGGGGIGTIANGGQLIVGNAAAFVAAGGAVTSNSALSGLTSVLSGGDFEVQSGALVALSGGLSVAAGGSVFVDTDNFAVGSDLAIAGGLTNAGMVQVGNATGNGADLVSIGGTLANTGTLNIFDDTASATVVSAGNLAVGGTINLSGDRGNRGLGPAELLATAAVAPTVLSSHITLFGPSLLDFGGGGGIGTIANGGQLIVGNAAAFVAAGGAVTSNSALSGLTSVLSGGDFEVQSGALVALSGGLSVAAGGSVFVDTDNFAVGSDLAIAGGLTNAGMVQVGNATGNGADLVSIGGTLANTGTLNIFDDTASATVVSASGLDNSGIINLQGNRGGRGTGPAELILGGSGTVGSSVGLNTGRITSVNGDGVTVAGGALLVNGSSGSGVGLISASGAGVVLSNGGSLTNYGTIVGSQVGAYLEPAGATPGPGVALTNFGLISGATGIIDGGPAATSDIIVNYGTISGTSGAGITLGSGADRVVDAGTITGADGTAVAFGSGVDLLVLQPAAVVTGTVGTLAGFGALDTIDLANVQATAAAFSGTTLGGTLTVNSTTAKVDLLLSGQFTYGANGFVLSPDGQGGVDINLRKPLGSVLKYTYGYAIIVTGANASTTVTSTGQIAAPSGDGLVNAVGVVATLTNLGRVTATATGSDGVYFGSGGIVTNSAGSLGGGYIAGAGVGVMIGGTAGAVSNAGTVVGGIGVAAGSGVTLTVANSGTIVSTGGTAGTAVALGGGASRLIVAPGAVFTGKIDGGGGASVLEIAATAGAAAGLAGRVAAAGAAAYVSLGSVVNFSALEVDPGATFGGSGVLSFASLVNAGQIDIGAGNSLALGVVASAANAGVIDLETGGTVAFHGAVAAQRLTFQPPGGTALIDRPEAFAATLSGFTGTLDLLDLTALNPAGATATLNASDQLVVADGTQSVALQLDTGTDYTGVTWQTSADGTGGTDVAPVCFCRGTRVLTERGEVAVEALRVGDRVATLAGSFKPITWIGFGRDLVTRRNSLARPIVVRKGALADGVPRRDLYLTHGHALYLDGVLIPVEHLVNHRSILWDEAARIVEYYHIELAGHDVVLAEGAPAESYYDAGNRALFHNTRPGSNSAAVSGPCAPVVTGGAVVERVWARLFTRAGGCSDTDTTDDPDLHLVVAGERLDPASVAGGLYTFALAAPPAGPLFLRSRSAVPSLTGQSRRDHRRLGVAIRQIVLQQPGIMTCLDHNAPAFRTGGCHLPEAGHSWTDGELALPAALFAHLGGPFALLLHTSRQALRYPIPAPPAAAHAA